MGESAKALAADLKDGEVMLLENVRFHKEEEKNDPEFCQGTCFPGGHLCQRRFRHRPPRPCLHCRRGGLPAGRLRLPDPEGNRRSWAARWQNPKRPFVAILGGAKVSDKIGVITNLLDKVDTLIIGGGMAYTFKAALGEYVGDSICETDKLDLAREIVKSAAAKNVKFMLPKDSRVGDRYAPDCDMRIALESRRRARGLIWASTLARRPRFYFADELKNAGTVIWNGPMGVSEWEHFASRHQRGGEGHGGIGTPSPSSAAATPPRRWSSWATPTR